MKRIFLAFVVVFSFIGVNAQNFSLLELMKMEKMSFAEFDTLILKSGFSFLHTTSNSGVGSYYKVANYSFDKNTCKKEKLLCGKKVNSRYSSVFFQTCDKSAFEKFKEEIINTGYKFTEEIVPEDEDEGKVHVYKKGNQVTELQINSGKEGDWYFIYYHSKISS